VHWPKIKHFQVSRVIGRRSMILVSKGEKRFSDLSQHCREEMIDEIFDGRVYK